MAPPRTTYKRQHAVALRYAEENRAPRVVASGAGELAKKILELAREHGVPVRKDDSLMDILARLDLGHEIPLETYRAIAQILAFLYRTDLAWRKKQDEAKSRISHISQRKQLE